MCFQLRHDPWNSPKIGVYIVNKLRKWVFAPKKIDYDYTYQCVVVLCRGLGYSVHLSLNP